MRRPRNQLILLGLICQGLSWDDYFLPLFNVVLWILCLTLPRKPIRLGPLTEVGSLALGCAAAFFLGRLMGQSTHFFIGHGLTLVQAARLLRPLTRREELFSILIACFHLAVGCTFIFDFRFIPILAAATILLPRAIMEFGAGAFPASRIAVRIRPGLGAYALIVFCMVLFFLVFPRVFLGSPFRTQLGGKSDQGTLADYVLDPSRSGAGQSGRIVLQVEGQDVGYLRCFALTDFDGLKWSRDKRVLLKRIEYLPRIELAKYRHRRVRVKNVGVLGRVLPTDGRVVGLDGKFFRRPFQNTHGIIECDLSWNTANNQYEYWIDPRPQPEPLPSIEIRKHTQHPPQSKRLQTWLDDRLAGIDEPRGQARHLEAWLRDKFTYNLGAPELSRLNAIDDFIFNQKEGHCERFAAALTLLLRMKGIPSRIVIGYVPSSRNWFSGQYNIRFKDAHSWTEAYFEDIGWVTLDATPRATAPLTSSSVDDLLETLDSFWYSNIVNFDGPTQKQLFSASLQSLANLPAWTLRNSGWLLVLIFSGAAVLAWRKYQSRKQPRNKPGLASPAAWVLAGDYYGQMLAALARRGFPRPAHQTPFEFVQTLKTNRLPFQSEALLITDVFCSARYGNQPVSPARQADIEQALERIKKSDQRSPGAETSSR